MDDVSIENVERVERPGLVIHAVAVCIQRWAWSLEVLAVHRREAPEVMCMPGGKPLIDRDGVIEDYRDAGVRETREETGLILSARNLGWVGVTRVQASSGGMLNVAVFWTLAPREYEPESGMGEPGMNPKWVTLEYLCDAEKHGRFAGPARLARATIPGVSRG